MATFTIEPRGGWRKGDRAYCIRGSSLCWPPLVVGRVYNVVNVRKSKSMVESALLVDGVRLHPGLTGISSARFVCIRRGKSALRQIAERTAFSWMEAYAASCGTKFVGIEHRERT